MIVRWARFDWDVIWAGVNAESVCFICLRSADFDAVEVAMVRLAMFIDCEIMPCIGMCLEEYIFGKSGLQI